MYLYEMNEECGYHIEEYEIVDGEMFLKSEKKSLEMYLEDLKIDWSDAICINLEKLRTFNLEELEIFLKISQSKHFDFKIDINALSLLECLVCMEYMLPPIHLCMTGHDICRNCRLKSNNCPTCVARYERWKALQC